MKKAIALLVGLFLLNSPSFADSIKCYSNGKVIYFRNIKDVTFTGEMFIFTEWGSDRVVFFSGDCIVKLDV